jgi:hypothetical protein
MVIHNLSVAFNKKYFFDFQKIKHSIFNLPGFKIYDHFKTSDDILKICHNDYEEQFLKSSPYFGYYSWKPKIIKNILEQINDEDILIYSDAMDIIHPSFLFEIKNYKFTNLILLNGSSRNRDYTKEDCFNVMGCESEKYYDALQLEAGFSLWKKTQFSINLLDEWEKYCFNLYANGEDKNLSGKPNSKRFVNHRHDQSILTNLKIKYKIPTLDPSARNYIECNVNNFLKNNLCLLEQHNDIQKYIIEIKDKFKNCDYQ